SFESFGVFFFSSRRRHTRFSRDWSSDVCSSDLRFILDSVLHERVVEDLVRESNAVFHLASAVGVKLIMQEPVKTLETIVGGTERSEERRVGKEGGGRWAAAQEDERGRGDEVGVT